LFFWRAKGSRFNYNFHNEELTASA
jgi:hypothetical protein